MPSIKAKWLRPATDIPFAEGILALNNSGAAVAANDLVLVLGAQANALAITRSDATSAIRTFPALSVAKHGIPDGRRGVIVPWAHITTVNTAATAVGGPIYAADAPNNGGWSLAQGTFSRQVGVVTASHATAGSVLLSPQAYDGRVANPANWFKSAEVTGNAGAQNTAHGLGRVPSLVFVTVVDNNGGVADILEGAHTAVNVIVTATAGAVYRVIAV
jgi:hypothetical protein